MKSKAFLNYRGHVPGLLQKSVPTYVMFIRAGEVMMNRLVTLHQANRKCEPAFHSLECNCKITGHITGCQERCSIKITKFVSSCFNVIHCSLYNTMQL